MREQMHEEDNQRGSQHRGRAEAKMTRAGVSWVVMRLRCSDSYLPSALPVLATRCHLRRSDVARDRERAVRAGSATLNFTGIIGATTLLARPSFAWLTALDDEVC